MDTLREYSFTWCDPRDVARAMAGKPHLEWMQNIITGESPPPPLGQRLWLCLRRRPSRDE